MAKKEKRDASSNRCNPIILIITIVIINFCGILGRAFRPFSKTADLPQISMKKTVFPAAALAFSLLLTSHAPAETVSIPEDQPAISLDIPHSWKPEVTDQGIGCESPDKVATIYFEVTPVKGVDALIDQNIDWLTKEQSVKVDKASEEKESFETGGLKWERISWTGDSKDWGASSVGFLFTDAGNGKILTVTYWITKEDQEKDFPTVKKILESVKLIGS
jgi:hypothetical protein